MHVSFKLCALLLSLIPAGSALAAESTGNAADSPERGRYLVRIAGCNDCHTPGWMQTGGQIPESDWLTGDALGWQGPWGTTYPVNLRLYMQNLGEDEWVNRAHTLRTLPPMPWFALNAMSDDDLRGLYRFIRKLGPKGEPVPAYVGPGQEPTTPYLVMTPHMPGAKVGTDD